MQWILCDILSEKNVHCPGTPSQSVLQQMWLPLHCMHVCIYSVSFLVFSLVRLVVGVTVLLAGGVAVLLAGGVGVLLAGCVAVLLAGGVAVLLAGGWQCCWLWVW